MKLGAKSIEILHLLFMEGTRNTPNLLYYTSFTKQVSLANLPPIMILNNIFIVI